MQAGIEGLVVLNTLSKRSAMTGYRSGLIAGDPEMIGCSCGPYGRAKGSPPHSSSQHAAVAAWDDEAHVAEQRDLYRAKRDVLLPVLARKGLRIAGSEATFYLWIRCPRGRRRKSFRLATPRAGLVLTPGSYFGARGEGYVRMALVPTVELCREAAAILEAIL